MQSNPGLFPSIPCPDYVSGFAWVYILQSTDGALYIGHTCNLRERARKHRLGLGSKHARDHTKPRLIFYEGPMTSEAAVQREAQLKRWSRAKKDALIRGDFQLLKGLSKSRESLSGT